MPNNDIPEYFAILRYIWRKIEISAIEGILKAQQNQEGDTDTVTVYLFLAKIRCRVSCRFSKLPSKGIPWIFRQFTVHWTKRSYWGHSWTKRSYWGHSKTKRGIPIPFTVTLYLFLANIRCRFSICLGFRGHVFFLVVPKNLECNKKMS